jgi:hypothetical protein
MLLHKKYNIEHSKVWMFAPAALYYGNTQTFFIEDKIKLAPGNRVNWNYHVAPAIIIHENDQDNFYVIDPCVNKNTPLLLGAWFKSIGNSSAGQYSFYSHKKYFFNCLRTKNNQVTSVFDGSFTSYDNPDKDSLIMEKGLAVNDTAMAIYNKYLKPLIDYGTEDRATLEDLKVIFGNSTALDMLLSQNISGNTFNTSHRYVVSRYGDILLDAKRIFNERIIFWTKYVNALL